MISAIGNGKVRVSIGIQLNFNMNVNYQHLNIKFLVFGHVGFTIYIMYLRQKKKTKIPVVGILPSCKDKIPLSDLSVDVKL